MFDIIFIFVFIIVFDSITNLIDEYMQLFDLELPNI